MKSGPNNGSLTPLLTLFHVWRQLEIAQICPSSIRCVFLQSFFPLSVFLIVGWTGYVGGICFFFSEKFFFSEIFFLLIPMFLFTEDRDRCSLILDKSVHAHSSAVFVKDGWCMADWTTCRVCNHDPTPIMHKFARVLVRPRFQQSENCFWECWC